MQNEGNGRPLASIIVNNYNYARFLGEAIDSALGQTYAPLEVVVVDDGSTDESREVIARYGDRITAVLKENGGQASALNAGFAASRGDLVLFLDADDALLPTTVERAAELFEQPGLVKVHWPMLEIDAQGQRTGELQPPYPLHQGDLRTRSLREGPVAGDAAPTSGNLWSRDLLERILPMPEQEYRINADGYLVMLAWIYGLVRTIDEPLSLYRVHGDNHHVVQARAKKRQQYLDFFLVHCRDLQRHFAGLGVDTDPNEWRINKDLCTFEERVDAAKRELATILDPGTRYILVDDQAWTPPTAEVLPGRTAVPFLERDGHYWGRPADDAAAIADLIRLREAGAEFIVFPWYARW